MKMEFKDIEIGMIPDMPKSLLRFLREKRFKKDSHRGDRAQQAAGKYSVLSVYKIRCKKYTLSTITKNKKKGRYCDLY